MSGIHPSAIIGQNVEIGKGTTIGPHVIIEDGVKIGSGNKIWANAYFCTGTEIGNDNDIHMNVVLGHAPQDLAFKNEPSYTRIGNRNVLREFVTIHRGTQPGSATVIGDDNFLMGSAHIAHNCRVGNHVIMANFSSLLGHCVAEDRAFISGICGFHQHTRIGTLALLGGLSAVNKDIPPFMICAGRPGTIAGINVIGLRRAGISAEIRAEIKAAYKLLYRSNLNVSQAVEEMKKLFKSKEVSHLIDFIENSSRGICAGTGQEKPGEENSEV